jgi:hypothetical protein
VQIPPCFAALGTGPVSDRSYFRPRAFSRSPTFCQSLDSFFLDSFFFWTVFFRVFFLTVEAGCLGWARAAHGVVPATPKREGIARSLAGCTFATQKRRSGPFPTSPMCCPSGPRLRLLRRPTSLCVATSLGWALRRRGTGDHRLSHISPARLEHA